MEIDWASFLGRPAVMVERALAQAVALDKSVLITGGGGSIGSGLARAILSGRPRSLVLLDSSEHALYESYRQVERMAKEVPIEVVPVVGSTADERLLGHLIRQHKPDLILHTAAYKHVPLMEKNPFSAIGNNVIGTYRLVTAALEYGASQLVMVSTDKAVNPQSIMGVSKRIAELVILSHSTPANSMNAVRLGNVLDSSGSVVAIFREQAESGTPLTVTHAEAQRYFLTLSEAEIAILGSATIPISGKVLVPDCGEAFRVVDLARYVADRSNSTAAERSDIRFIGLRPGDKIREELISSEEQVESVSIGGMRVVASPCPNTKEIAKVIDRIATAIDNSNYPLLMEIIIQLVPGYGPASHLPGGQR